MEKCYKLRNHPSANCLVTEVTAPFVGKMTTLRSYETDVLDVVQWSTGDICVFPLDAMYSRTTSRQVGWFLEEIFPKILAKDVRYAQKHDKFIMIEDGVTKFLDFDRSIVEGLR